MLATTPSPRSNKRSSPSAVNQAIQDTERLAEEEKCCHLENKPTKPPRD